LAAESNLGSVLEGQVLPPLNRQRQTLFGPFRTSGTDAFLPRQSPFRIRSREDHASVRVAPALPTSNH